MILMMAIEVDDEPTSALYKTFGPFVREEAVLGTLRRYVQEHIDTELDTIGFEMLKFRAWIVDKTPALPPVDKVTPPAPPLQYAPLSMPQPGGYCG